MTSSNSKLKEIAEEQLKKLQKERDHEKIINTNKNWQKERLLRNESNKQQQLILHAESEDWPILPVEKDPETSETCLTVIREYLGNFGIKGSTQKCPTQYLSPVNPLPPMFSWTTIPRNVRVEDTHVLDHIPFLGDETVNGNFIQELIQQYGGKMHENEHSDSTQPIDDDVLLDLVKVLSTQETKLKRIKSLTRTPESKEGEGSSQMAGKPEEWEELQEAIEKIRKSWKRGENLPDPVVFHTISLISPTSLTSKDILFKYLSLIGENPEESNKTLPNLDDFSVESNSHQKTLLTYKTLFCRRCFRYDCDLHWSPQEPVEPQKLPANSKNTPKQPCGPNCFLSLKESTGQANDANNNPFDEELNVETDKIWTGADVSIFNIYNDIFPENYCEIAKILIFKTCQEVYNHAQKQNPSAAPKVEAPKATNRKSRKGKNKLTYQTPAIKDEDLHFSAHFKPCNHQGPCTKENCRCFENGTFCEKFCCCSIECKIRFKGCRCQSTCQTKSCPCFLALRECDPDLCKVCKAYEFDHSKIICKNVGILKGNYKRLLLAPSDVSGWGVFSKDTIAKNEFIYEYTGEVISQEEAEKRGKVYDKTSCSYLFNLNDDFVVDATIMGNIIRFANHSKTPNCFAKVLSVCGDHRIGIFAAQQIDPGQELFFDYSKFFPTDF